MLLPLAGCYVAQPAPSYGYAAPGYPPPGYPQPEYPPLGYPPASYDPYGNVYPGYSYNDGAPTLFVDGAVAPLILLGGGWGYYDAHHDWHRAPEAVSRHLEQQRAAGASFPAGGGGYPQPRPAGGYPPPRPGGGAEPNRGQPQYRPAAQPAREEHERGHDCPPGQRC